MERALGYIIGKLEDTEVSINKLAKNLRKQRGINRRFAFLFMGFSAYICANEYLRKENEEQIDLLKKEIKELKKEKEE